MGLGKVTDTHAPVRNDGILPYHYIKTQRPWLYFSQCVLHAPPISSLYMWWSFSTCCFLHPPRCPTYYPV